MLKKIWNFGKEFIVILGLAFLLSIAIKYFLVDNRVVPTSSMVPTVPTGARLLANQLSYRFGEPEFGDIVVFEPNESTKVEVGRTDDMLKRVIGVSGDEILITDGVLYRNGEAVDEPYIAAAPEYEYGPVTVPEDCVFLLGDNRNKSYDSHLWGEPFVPVDNVHGKAFLIYWPIGSFGLVE